MDDRVKQLKTPEECDNFINNVKGKYPELAKQAHRRKVEIKASLYGTTNSITDEAEIEALMAIYAYEEALLAKHGRKTPAARTWQMVRNHGIIGAVERAVKRETPGFKTLVDMGMPDFLFEAVVIRHEKCFSQEAVALSKKRLEALKAYLRKLAAQ
jgi:hypothetical protein